MARPVLACADWSVSLRKRWVALAFPRARGGFAAYPPEPVGEPARLVRRLRARAGPRPLLLGVDFPVGVPGAWARRAGVRRFRRLLRRLGERGWRDFFRVARSVREVSLRRPFYPARPGGASRAALTRALGLDGAPDLLRACERARPGRRAACPLFWTLGPSQVGKAALVGWRAILGAGALPEEGLALWPFDGDLPALLAASPAVAAECWPAAVAARIGLRFRGGKGDARARRRAAGALLAAARRAGLRPSARLAAEVRRGFGPGPEAEDRLDAFVGLVGMAEVVSGLRPEGAPRDPQVRRVEGWILGEVAAGGDAGPPPARRRAVRGRGRPAGRRRSSRRGPGSLDPAPRDRADSRRRPRRGAHAGAGARAGPRAPERPCRSTGLRARGRARAPAPAVMPCARAAGAPRTPRPARAPGGPRPAPRAGG